METDYRNSKSSLFKVWMITGIILGILFAILIGNTVVGLMVGMAVSFLAGIICKRTHIINE